jgi:hypothetical protein
MFAMPRGRESYPVRDLGRISALFDQVRTGDKVIIHW